MNKVMVMLAAAGIFSASAHAERFYRVGTGAGCTHATIQSAIDAAAVDLEDSVIMVSRTLSYSNQAIRKTFTANDMFLKIKGGYPTCADNVADSSYTTIDGTGGIAQSVMSFQGVAYIGLQGLNIIGGDAEDGEYGGGIYFAAEGTLALANSTVRNNRAGYGGGIAVRHSKAALAFGDSVWVYDNYAARTGGGVLCQDGSMSVRANDTGIFNNRALIDAGGLRLANCDAELASNGPLDAGILYGNSSGSSGGGLSITDSTARIFTRDAQHPTRISFNKSHAGGAMIVRDQGHVVLFDVIVEGNEALDGGVAYLTSNVQAIPTIFATTVRAGNVNVPFGALACAAGIVCNRFFNNIAKVNGSGPGEGAIVYSTYDKPWDCSFPFACFWPVGFPSKPDFEMAMIDHNTGHNLFRISQYDDNYAIAQSQITHNTVRDSLFKAVSDDKLWLSQNTISHNQVATSLVKSKNLAIDCSIINQSNRVHEGTGLTANFVLLPNSALLPPSTAIIQGTPRFIDANANNFRLYAPFFRGDLGPASPGIDFGSAACGPFGTALDLDGRSRPVDLTGVTNQFGAFDLGAFETRPPPPIIFLP